MTSETTGDFRIQPFSRPEIYELRVNGRLGQESASWFEDMTLLVDESTSPAQTIMRGAIRDESALYGLISRIRDLGLTLLSVQRLNVEETSENIAIMEEFLSSKFGSATKQMSIKHPAGWVVQEDRAGNLLAMANSETALERFIAGKVELGDFAMNVGFIPAAFFEMEAFANLDIQLGATPDAFLQSIMPMLRLTGAKEASTVVSDGELVSLSDEVEAGLLSISSEEREGMLIVFEAAEGVIAFVSTSGYPGEAAGSQETALAVAASIEYTGSAESLAAAFLGN